MDRTAWVVCGHDRHEQGIDHIFGSRVRIPLPSAAVLSKDVWDTCSFEQFGTRLIRNIYFPCGNETE